MANLPEKNITTVDKITSIPSNTNLYINANGEFRQATVDDVLKASPVIADSITNQYKNASGSPILLTDSAKGVVIDFDVKGRSTQDGEPTPTEPITPKSNGDMGYFDGELLNGIYTNGVHGNLANYVCSKNRIPCQPNDKIEITYDGACNVVYAFFYDENGAYLSHKDIASNKLTTQAIANAYSFHIGVYNANGLTVATAKHICVTINDKYALIVKSKGKNLLNIRESDKDTKFFSYTKYTNEFVKATATKTSAGEFICSFSAYLEKGKTYTFSYESINGMSQVYIYYDKLWGNNVSFLNISYTSNYTHNVDSGIYIIGYFGAITSGTEYSVVKPMLRRAEVKYIPLNEPLRSSLDGSVTDVASLSECEVNRKLIERVFDGSDDEGWTVSGGFAIITVSDAISTNSTYGELICSHFRYVGQSADVGACFNYNQRFHFAITQSTLDEWLAWLQANPITVIYELAEPTTESIEPIDVDTFEGVTQVSVSDNTEMEVEYPTSKVAGIASIGWSKGRRAEYDLEQLKVQMLALQTTIVSTV